MSKNNTTPQYIINDLTLVSPDRQRKDIQSLKNAVLSAESISLPNRAKLYDLYHDILSLDGFLQGITAKRINSVLNKKLKFYDRNKKENEEITKLMKSEAGREIISQIVNSEFWGVSGIEFKIGEKLAFDEIPRKHIRPEKGTISKTQYGLGTDDFKIEELPFVWVIGRKNNLGLFLACSMYGIYKRGNFGDWAQYVEIFGQPVRVMYYDAYDTATKNELKKILTESGSSLAIMLPKQATFEMKDGKASNGSGELQKSFKDACNEEMAVAILGNTETTSSSKSSGYAQSKEHGEQQDEIIASDLILVENHLNSDKFISILKSYGYDVEGGYFKYELELNLDKLKSRLEIDMRVSEKVPVSDDYWYETYGIPKPENYNELKKEMQERQNPAAYLTPQNSGEKNKEEKEGKEDEKDKNKQLADLSSPNWYSKIFESLADFFAHARP